MTLTMTDIFAGAGGSSSGAASVPGVDVRVAANHWQMAVDVHQINHPATDHACVDLHLEDWASRVVIAAALKWEIRDKLDQANVTERVLFPGLDGISRWLARYYAPRWRPE